MKEKSKSEREALAEAVRFLSGLLEGEGEEPLAERAGRAGFPPALLTRLTALFRRPDRPRLPASASLLVPGEAARLGELLRAVEAVFLHQLAPGPEKGEGPEEIQALVDELVACRPEEARILIAKGRDYGRWEICLRLCEESDEAVAESSERAARLARLALAVAGRVEKEDPAFRGKLSALARAHLDSAEEGGPGRSA